MKSSCIRHSDREILALLRQFYIPICSGDLCAAVLLSNFEYWHNYKLDRREQEIAHGEDDPNYKPDLSLWVYKSTNDFVTDMLGLYKRDTVLKALKLLESLDFIHIQPDPKNPFNKTRFFMFRPERVNERLEEIHSSRKIDSRKTENRLSPSRKIDSLPYIEITSREGEQSLACGKCADTGWTLSTKSIRGIGQTVKTRCTCHAGRSAQ